ncbi:MAG TPA: DUF5683 domain-containing protein [Chitinophagales bacterium]|nr:hypothetical protein [Chitinophagales bacterium]MCB9018973.1 hypothetical protein [Chitinophagales bacterium]MCB9032102.1 hypothetical protein [Chitinophagales bacterium]HPE98078.1 DUF5683 domain-containing protein [Chitinophagales bacterium]HPR28833.1 DUF5683 domain-containing protein [Chitinophagales bacterium]
MAIAILFAGNCLSQTDSLIAPTEIRLNAVTEETLHSPKKAALYSALLPGLGQAYNQKYWKIPVVYTALGISGYSIWFNARYYSDLKNAYLIRTDGDSTTIDQYANILPVESQLIQYAEFYKKSMDLSVIITAAIWTLNIVDAVVDAHLYNFDISDDLSMQIKPAFRREQQIGGNGVQTWNSVYGVQIKLSIR